MQRFKRKTVHQDEIYIASGDSAVFVLRNNSTADMLVRLTAEMRIRGIPNYMSKFKSQLNTIEDIIDIGHPITGREFHRRTRHNQPLYTALRYLDRLKAKMKRVGITFKVHCPGLLITDDFETVKRKWVAHHGKYRRTKALCY